MTKAMNEPKIPEGYEKVAVGDEKVGDLGWNAISKQWEPIREVVVWVAHGFDSDVFHFRPIRKTNC